MIINRWKSNYHDSVISQWSLEERKNSFRMNDKGDKGNGVGNDVLQSNISGEE